MAASVKNSEQLQENNEKDCASASLAHLPTEILEHILTNDSLNYIDLINFGQTCSYFGKVCQFNELWKQKMSQRSVCLTCAKILNHAPQRRFGG